MFLSSRESISCCFSDVLLLICLTLDLISHAKRITRSSTSLQFGTRNNILVHTFSSWMGLIASVLFSRSSPTFPQSWSSDLTSSHLHPAIVSTKTQGWQAQILRWSSYLFCTTIFFFLPFLSSFHSASILSACKSASHQVSARKVTHRLGKRRTGVQGLVQGLGKGCLIRDCAIIIWREGF